MNQNTKETTKDMLNRNYMRTVYVEKKNGFNVEAQKLLKDIQVNLRINSLKNIRILNKYEILGVNEKQYKKGICTVFSEPNVDIVYEGNIPKEDIMASEEPYYIFGYEFLPGQYDQRADSAAQCMEIITMDNRPDIFCGKIIVLYGELSSDEIEKIKAYCINPVDSREIVDFGNKRVMNSGCNVDKVEIIHGFCTMNDNELNNFILKLGLAMSLEDLKLCKGYFNCEHRDPTITEIKVLDTYWSDHCRHTTFSTVLNSIEFQQGKFSEPIKKAYEDYLCLRKSVYEEKEKDITLMDMAVMGMKYLRKTGDLSDLDSSEEINACSINYDVDIDGKKIPYLIQFKNETHNHPTEIEPFGGAATCLGGAIRDPLSGRAYVYQAMRVTGASDPREAIEDTLPGKLPQRKICLEAAHGYSSYGNQIGLATGHVSEIYHPGYKAKRMEIGAVVGAVPKENVIRLVPEESDVVILLGGRTGRDGCGGATGSSKAHNENSLECCGAEVQKGNAPTERKLQRFFRNNKVSIMIKRCNDFGAGGVSVAIGELADGLVIDLDKVPKKYDGLDGTELAISESQERMAVVVTKENAEMFIKLAQEENIEATIVARVTSEKRLIMLWNGNKIVDINRDFLDTNGAKANTDVYITCPNEDSYFNKSCKQHDETFKNRIMSLASDINVCSQKGLVERFDSTIGTVNMFLAFGGKFQMTPTQCMASKVAVLEGDCNTATIMAYGYNPYLSTWSPFHGGVYAVVEAICKTAASGADYKKTRLSFQEYFERLEDKPERWGKPTAALLGALTVQNNLKTPAIGGKDSMSGSFKEISVPPTLVAFALNVEDSKNVISPELKKTNSKIVMLRLHRDNNEMPVFEELKKNLEKLHAMILNKKVISCYAVTAGGVLESIMKMSFGNKIGIQISDNVEEKTLLSPEIGSLVMEIPAEIDLDSELSDYHYLIVGNTNNDKTINYKDNKISIDEIIAAWEEPLQGVYTTKAYNDFNKIEDLSSRNIMKNKVSSPYKLLNNKYSRFASPKVFIPVFPGTNCEYDSAKAFAKAGAEVDTLVFKNYSKEAIQASIELICKKIMDSQMIMLPGGFSAGDEPDGSGKFIAAVFRNPLISEKVMELIKNKNGLMLGICNGFQALIKLGLLPYGEIRDIDEASPTLTYNKIGRHVSTMVRTKVVSKLSPWFKNVEIGDVHTIPVSHGEGRFVASKDMLNELINNNQVATQYVDLNGNSTMELPYNPNGSTYGIEAITSLDGRILGKMGHSERNGKGLYINIPGEKDQQIFKAGVEFFK